jgi:hypothetical protein
VTSLSPSKWATDVLATKEQHLITSVVMRYVQRVTLTLRDLDVVGLRKTFQQMHPTFWLNDHHPRMFKEG